MQGQSKPFLTPNCCYDVLFPEILMKWVQFVAFEGLGLSDTVCTIWGGFCENMCWIVASWVTPAAQVASSVPVAFADGYVVVCREGTHGPAPLPAREILWKCPWRVWTRPQPWGTPDSQEEEEEEEAGQLTEDQMCVVLKILIAGPTSHSSGTGQFRGAGQEGGSGCGSAGRAVVAKRAEENTQWAEQKCAEENTQWAGASARWGLKVEHPREGWGVTSVWESPHFGGAEVLFHQGDVRRAQGPIGVWRCPSSPPLGSEFGTGLCKGCCPALECFFFSGAVGEQNPPLPSTFFQNCTGSKVSIFQFLVISGLTPVLSWAVPKSVGIRFHVLLEMGFLITWEMA